MVAAVNLTVFRRETHAPVLRAITVSSVSLKSSLVSLLKAVVWRVPVTALKAMIVFVKQVIQAQPVTPLISVLLIKAQIQVVCVLLNSPQGSVVVTASMVGHVCIWTDGKHVSAPLAGEAQTVPSMLMNVPRTLVRTGCV